MGAWYVGDVRHSQMGFRQREVEKHLCVGFSELVERRGVPPEQRRQAGIIIAEPNNGRSRMESNRLLRRARHGKGAWKAKDNVSPAEDRMRGGWIWYQSERLFYRNAWDRQVGCAVGLSRGGSGRVPGAG